MWLFNYSHLKGIWHFKVKESMLFVEQTLIKTKQHRKWKIPYTVWERRTLCFNSYKNRELKVTLWWVRTCERKNPADKYWFPGRPPPASPGRPLKDLENTQTWMSKFFLTFLSELIRLTKSKSISTLKVCWEPSKTSKMEHFLQN